MYWKKTLSTHLEYGMYWKKTLSAQTSLCYVVEKDTLSTDQFILYTGKRHSQQRLVYAMYWKKPKAYTRVNMYTRKKLNTYVIFILYLAYNSIGLGKLF